jgi:hypothetical protein
MTISEDAMSLWIEAHDKIERKLGKNGEFAEIKATGSKSADNTLRIAGVLTLVDDPEASTIDKESMLNAIKLGEYYQYEALRLATKNKIDLVLPRAQLLLDWLQDSDQHLYSTRHIYRYAPSSIGIKGGREQAMKLIQILIDYGWLKPAPADTIIDGKQCKEAWELQTVLEEV